MHRFTAVQHSLPRRQVLQSLAVLKSFCALKDVYGSLVLPAVVERLDVANQIKDVAIREGESLVGPVERRVVQLIRCVLLYKAPSFCKHAYGVLYLEIRNLILGAKFEHK